jgi:polyphosphate kinase
MPRNLNRRVEIVFPVEDEALRGRIRDEILAEYLLDNVKARRMQPDGTYKRLTRSNGQALRNAQERLLGNKGEGKKKGKLTW